MDGGAIRALGGGVGGDVAALVDGGSIGVGVGIATSSGDGVDRVAGGAGRAGGVGASLWIDVGPGDSRDAGAGGAAHAVMVGRRVLPNGPGLREYGVTSSARWVLIWSLAQMVLGLAATVLLWPFDGVAR